jgi:hypothetical protein
MNGYQADTTYVGPYQNGADRNGAGTEQNGFNSRQNGTAGGDRQNGALGNGSRQNGFGQNSPQQNGPSQNGSASYQVGPQAGGPYQPGAAPGGAGQSGARPGGHPGAPGAPAQSGFQNGYPAGAQNGYSTGSPQTGPYQGGPHQAGAAPFGGYEPAVGGPSAGQSQQARPGSGQGFEAAPVPGQYPPYRPYEQAPYPGSAAGEPIRPGSGPGQGQPGGGFAPPGQYQAQYPGQEVAQVPAARPAQPAPMSLPDAVRAAHAEGFGFGESVGRDAPGLWLEAVLARKPRMPSDLEARLLQGSALPIDSLLHDEVRHSLRRGFWEALENARR